MRFNRNNFPSDLAAADTARGESKFAVGNHGVLAVKYRTMQNKVNSKPKVVYMLSTDHPNTVAAAPKTDKGVSRNTTPAAPAHSMKLYTGAISLPGRTLQLGCSVLLLRLHALVR